MKSTWLLAQVGLLLSALAFSAPVKAADHLSLNKTGITSDDAEKEGKDKDKKDKEKKK
jgi:hypothetical protein